MKGGGHPWGSVTETENEATPPISPPPLPTPILYCNGQPKLVQQISTGQCMRLAAEATKPIQVTAYAAV